MDLLKLVITGFLEHHMEQATDSLSAAGFLEHHLEQAKDSLLAAGFLEHYLEQAKDSSRAVSPKALRPYRESGSYLVQLQQRPAKVLLEQLKVLA